MSSERIVALAVELAQLSQEEQAELVREVFGPGKDLQLLLTAVKSVASGPDGEAFMNRLVDVLQDELEK